MVQDSDISVTSIQVSRGAFKCFQATRHPDSYCVFGHALSFIKIQAQIQLIRIFCCSLDVVTKI